MVLSDLSRVFSLVISRVLSVSCAICRFLVLFSLGSSSSTVTIYLRLISHWYRARMWLLVVAVLRHDKDSFELTSVAQLRRDWVAAHMPTRGTMVSSRFQGRNAWVHFCSHFRSSRHAKVGLVLSRILQRSPRLCFDFVLAFSLRVSRVPVMSHG